MLVHKTSLKSLCALLILLALYQVSRLRSQSTSQLTMLAPKSSFDVPIDTGYRIIDFFANNTGLYFGCRNDITQESHLLRTDSSGRGLDRISLPPSRLYLRRVRADSGSRLAVLSIRPATETAEVFLYEEHGAIPKRIQLAVQALDIEFVQGNLIAFTYDSALLISSPNGQPVSPPSILARTDIDAPFLTSALPRNKVGIVSLPDAEYRVFSMDSKDSIPSLPLIAPEIRRKVSTTAQSNSALIHTIATADDGTLYCGLTGFKLTDGAICEEFDQAGIFRRSIRFVLPEFPELTNDLIVKNSRHFGHVDPHLIPTQFGVSDNHLFWLDASAKKVAVYLRP